MVVSSNRGSEENSDDFQAVAEEDISSFILHRNAYLDGDIMTAESQLFKVSAHLKLGVWCSALSTCCFRIHFLGPARVSV